MAPRNEETTTTLLDCVKHVKNIPVRGREGGWEGGREGEEGGREGGRGRGGERENRFSDTFPSQRILSRMNAAQVSMSDWQSLYKVRREGGRKGERGREGGREEGKEGGREGGRKGGREGGREEGRKGEREGGEGTSLCLDHRLPTMGST